MHLLWQLLLVALFGGPSKAGPLVGLLPTYKAWWAKEILVGDLYTAGRLSESQIKYASEAGFNSMVAMFYYVSGSRIGEEILPRGDKERDLAERVAGLEFTHILTPTESWKKLETVRRFGNAYRSMTKPILFHCTSSYSASATSLMYFLNNTKHNPTQQPKVTLDEFFRQSTAMGYDYGSDEGVMKMIREIMGRDDIVPPVRPNVTMPDWNSKFWLVRAIHDNWYAAGQVRSNYLPMIKEANFDSVVNLRLGLTNAIGQPSQGEVTLLNVKDDTGTYTGGGRQTKTELEKNRINPNQSNSYIGPGSKFNYQMQNALEFGDRIGYNDRNEEVAFEVQKIEYHHIPLGNKSYPLDQWRAHKTLLLKLGQSRDAILMHSRNAENAAMMGLLSVGCQHQYRSEWAIEKARRLGFHWDQATHPQVIIAFRTVLDNQAIEC